MHSYRRWTPPVASRIPDVTGWLQDMHSAQELAERLIREAGAEPPDPVLLDALSTATLVRYSRCFTTGIRERLSIANLPSTTETEVELHERLRGIRDWHIAHPVNQQEVHALYVILDEAPGATTGAIGFSSLSSTQLSLLPFEAKEMLELCSKWIVWLNEQLIQENTRLMPYANKLSRDELLSLPQDEPQSNTNIHARRTQQRREA
jgi:hypothetical protein